MIYSQLFRYIRLILVIMLIGSILSTVNATSFYQDNEGKYLVFTTNSNPLISLNLESRSNSVLVVDEILINNVKREYSNLPRQIQPFTSVNLNFEIPLVETLSSTPIQIKINSLDSTSQELEIAGDPTQFHLKYVDSQQSTLTSYRVESNGNISLNQLENSNIIIREGDSRVFLDFPLELIEYDVRINSNLEKDMSTTSKKLAELPKIISLDTSSLTKGNYPLQITYRDVTNQVKQLNLNLLVLEEPLKITKVYSNQDEMSYNYYFNTKFSDSEVYSNSRNFDLVFDTNQEASCYKEELATFNDFVTSTPLTNQVTTHRIPISIENARENGIWIMCQNLNSSFAELDRVYLSEALFNKRDLFSAVFLENIQPIRIISAEPNGLLTSEPIIIDARTSSRGVCKYSVESLEISSDLDSTEEQTRHRKTNVLASQRGEFEIKIDCFDRLYNTDTKTLQINIDSTEQIRIVSFVPKLVFTELANIEIQITDTSATCRIEAPSIREASFTPARVEGRTLYFEDVGPFIEEGKIDMRLICVNQESRVSRNEFSLTFDKTQPTISGVRLFNSKLGPTTFFSDSSFMRIEVDSTIRDLAYYLVEFTNSDIVINSSSSRIDVTDDFSQDTSLKIRGFDIYGRSTNEFVSNYQFDTTPPAINIKMGSSSTKLIIECDGGVSGCNTVQYDLSSTRDNCQPRTSYENSSEIDVFGKIFICVKAIDNAGNEVTLIEEINARDNFTPPPREDDQNPPIIDDQTPPRNDTTLPPIVDDSQDDDPFRPIDPIAPDEEEFNWILLSAFAFVLLLVGAGGYYAYNRGYLDNQLIAMGVKKKRTNSSSDPYKGVVPYSQIPRKDLNKGSTASAIASQGVSNTGKTPNKYDSHLSKLNEFIDSTLKKDSNMFDEFKKDNTKGKTDNFKDTLLKNRKSVKDEKESFEDFYKSSKEKEKNESNKAKK
ncbi:MAG: hypothetical protein LAT82_01835 [Nanoarchaeota archaeon]|nr:hypothetical protein [Nanoarchaeota archaeon]